jgi:LacI family transcriptional regulator
MLHAMPTQEPKRLDQTKRTTIKDVAKRAGVSIATVSNSLSHGQGVGKIVRKRVLAAAAELSYQPNRAAQATRTGRSRTLAFVTPDLCNPFYPKLAQAITNAARAAGYAVLLVDTQDGATERECLEHVARYDVDGVLWCPASPHDVIAESNFSAPVTVIDQWLPGRDTITADYRMSGKLIADHVVKCGYRSIGMISGPQDISAAKLRRDYFLASLGNRVPVAWEIFHPFAMELSDEGRAMVSRRDVDVLVCCDDLIAVGALQVALDEGIAVPRDVAIIGHDDVPIASIVRPQITTIRQPLDQLGAEAVKTLLERLEDPKRPRRDVSIDVELVVRGSSF